MTTKRLGLIMNGVTGRMGLNQHLARSIIAIRDSGGVVLSNGDRMMPDPILIGRDADKIGRLAKQFNVARFSTDLDKALADKNDTIFFDAATTQARPSLLAKAINAGKHVYCEKPIATNLEEAVAVVKLANAKGVKHGTVQDKLFLPGLKKLAFLRDSGFFGRMLSVRGEIAHINMSWVTRVYRDDLVTFQVDGTLGSAVAGLSDCVIQARQATPRPVWNPDEKRLHNFYADWQRLPDNAVYDNGFKEQWEMFIRHVCENAPHKYTLLEGAKGVQRAECALQSWRERRWIDVAPIKV